MLFDYFYRNWKQQQSRLQPLLKTSCIAIAMQDALIKSVTHTNVSLISIYDISCNKPDAQGWPKKNGATLNF